MTGDPPVPGSLTDFDRIVILRSASSAASAGTSLQFAELIGGDEARLSYVDLLQPGRERIEQPENRLFEAYLQAVRSAAGAAESLALVEWHAAARADRPRELTGVGVPAAEAPKLAGHLESAATTVPRPDLHVALQAFRDEHPGSLVDLQLTPAHAEGATAPARAGTEPHPTGFTIGLREAILFSLLAVAVSSYAAYVNLAGG